MQEITSLFDKYEQENFFDEFVYFRMLSELQKNSNDHNFYWRNKGYRDPEDLAEFFKQLLKTYENSDDPRIEEDEFKKIYEYLITWYKILGDNNKAELLEKYSKLAEVKELTVKNKMLGVISFFDPNMKIKVDNFEFKNIDSFNDSLNLVAALSNKNYLSFLKANENTFNELKQYINPHICNIAIIHNKAYDNPVLNSEDDITDDIINRIRSNSLESLTINYEFCLGPKKLSPTRYPEIRGSGYRGMTHYVVNPFYLADFEDYDRYVEYRNGSHRYTKWGNLKKLEFEIILGPNVRSLKGAFSNFPFLESVNIKSTANITDMSEMFQSADYFNQDISNWDTSNVTNMSSMFSGARSFNQPIGNWDTSKVTDMSWMFYNAYSFNQDISNWDLSSLKDSDHMFEDCPCNSNYRPRKR